MPELGSVSYVGQDVWWCPRTCMNVQRAGGFAVPVPVSENLGQTELNKEFVPTEAMELYVQVWMETGDRCRERTMGNG